MKSYLSFAVAALISSGIATDLTCETAIDQDVDLSKLSFQERLKLMCAAESQSGLSSLDN